jgi:N,N'-diacetyllegionaminate synthase
MSVEPFSIGPHPIRRGGRCLIVAEVAQAHDGSLGTAHAFIDAIADAGADAVKFQTHIASAESTPAEPWRVKFSFQDDTRYDYWKRMEFSESQWRGLKRHADERGLVFLSSPFSEDAVSLLERVGVCCWKVASGEVNTAGLFERMIATRLPVLLSTGMSSLEEIDQAVSRLRGRGVPFAVLQCTSRYPCPPDKVGLDLVPFFRQRYDAPAGLSDHSGKVYPGLAGAAIGIEILEVHVTLSREMFGPDVPASITTAELRQLTEGIRFIEVMKSNPINKDALAEETAPLRRLFTKSLVYRADLPAGTVLGTHHLASKKPGTGIAGSKMREIVNRKLKRSVAADTLVTEDDLEP